MHSMYPCNILYGFQEIDDCNAKVSTLHKSVPEEPRKVDPIKATQTL